MSKPLWKIALDESEAKGEVWIERRACGFDVFVKGALLDADGKERPVCWVDLFPASKSGQELDEYHLVIAQVVVDNPDDEDKPLAQWRVYQNSIEQVI